MTDEPKKRGRPKKVVLDENGNPKIGKDGKPVSPNLKPFSKGDPRINRKGSPKDFWALRRLAKEIGGETIKYGNEERTRVELILQDWATSRDPKKQQSYIRMAYGSPPNRPDTEDEAIEDGIYLLPSLYISPNMAQFYRDVSNHVATEFVAKGGRGSTKSSAIAEIIIERVKNNPEEHVLVVRQVAATLRDSVFSQLVWAISYLGMEAQFHTTQNPLEITYKKTGQKIFFRGGDDPLKIKSIKPPFGYISTIWFEELDQFRGPEAVRSIIQSALRGGDTAYIFKSFNPPKSRNSWVLKELEYPKENRRVYHTDYRGVPEEWLGRAFLDEAEFLKEVNPMAYEHEYLGVPNAAGGSIFDNAEARVISDDEILAFDDPKYGVDWGWFPDPFMWTKSYYDPARLTLWIYDEYRSNKQSNKENWEYLVENKGMESTDLIICDSAEPKSIADWRSYGANARPAEKGPESRTYSHKWLQSLVKIVIDPVRCPHTAQEFLDYEYEMDKDGNFLNDYPDKNNHAIDAIRYAHERVWKRRGK